MHAHFDRWLTPDLRVRGWRADDGCRYGAGAHDAVEVALCAAGGLAYRVGRGTYAVAPGEAIVLPAGFEHATSVAPGTRARSFWIGATVAAEVEAELGALPDPAVRPSARLARFAEPLFDEAVADEVGGAVLGGLLARALLVELLRDPTNRGCGRALPDAGSERDDPRVRRAVARIDDAFAEPLSVDDLAATAGLSRYHFTRLFKASTGVSPYRYLIDRRVDAAAALLADPERSVTDVAFTVGFTDLSRFARAFRRRMGDAPSAYAARIAERSARIA